ncbi:recombinase family protein [Amylibacter sp.]|nr:recombinase family protein [Amylibacter sp.]
MVGKKEFSLHNYPSPNLRFIRGKWVVEVSIPSSNRFLFGSGVVRAIDLAEKTGATLLVAKLDRLSRKVSYVSAIMERKKLNLIVATMPNADKFQLHIYAALAEQEREFISLRTKQALAPLKGTCKPGGNRGNIDRANKAARKVADDHASKVIDTIAPLKQAGRTLQQIADTLNKSVVLTSRGGQWYLKHSQQGFYIGQWSPLFYVGTFLYWVLSIY